MLLKLFTLLKRHYRLILATSVAIALCGAFAVTLWIGAHLSAPVPRPATPPPDYLKAESVRIPSTSGSTLSAWLAVPENPKGAVVLLHCVRCNRLDMLSRGELLWSAGYAVLLPDLQAHGESPGDAITFGYLESRDAIASVEYLRHRFTELPIGGLGSSLGGAAFLLAAESLSLDALVLESVYPTIDEAVDNRIAIRLGPLSKILAPMLLFQLKPRLGVAPSDLRPIDHLDAISFPVLVMGGTLDQHTTEAETRRLFDAAREPKELWLVEGAEHEDLLRFDPEAYSAVVSPFFGEHLRK